MKGKLGWLLLAVAVAVCLWLEFRPRSDRASRLDTLPLKGLNFESRDLPLSEVEQTVFKRARVIKRLVKVGPHAFVLVAVDGSQDRHAVHDPQYCFRGAGWTMTGSSPFKLSGGEGRLVHLRKGTQSVEALYWFTDGRSRHASAWRVWWSSVRSRLPGGDTAPSPVLVLLQPLANGAVDYQQVLTQCPPLTIL